MSDDLLRELERERTLAPEDGSILLRIARVLAQSGRFEEALERLRAIPGEHTALARATADELWIGELRALEKTLSLRSPSPTRVQLSDTKASWDTAGGVVTADLVAKRVLRGTPHDWTRPRHPIGDARPRDQRHPRVHSVLATIAPPRLLAGESELVRFPDGARPLVWSPDGHTLLVVRGPEVDVWQTPTARARRA